MENIEIQKTTSFTKFNNLNNLVDQSNIRLACVEDGLENIGFRKFAAYVK